MLRLPETVSLVSALEVVERVQDDRATTRQEEMLVGIDDRTSSRRFGVLAEAAGRTWFVPMRDGGEGHALKPDGAAQVVRDGWSQPAGDPERCSLSDITSKGPIAGSFIFSNGDGVSAHLAFVGTDYRTDLDRGGRDAALDVVRGAASRSRSAMANHLASMAR